MADENDMTTDHAAREPVTNAEVADATGDPSSTGGARMSLKEGAAKLQKQATGKVYSFAEDGKAKAGGALDEFSRLMEEAAGSVDGTLGAQYGDYARSAAQAISGYSTSLKDKGIDELLDEVRVFARKSPAIAVGTAAAIGFVLARLVKSGLDDNSSGA